MLGLSVPVRISIADVLVRALLFTFPLVGLSICVCVCVCVPIGHVVAVSVGVFPEYVAIIFHAVVLPFFPLLYFLLLLFLHVTFQLILIYLTNPCSLYLSPLFCLWRTNLFFLYLLLQTLSLSLSPMSHNHILAPSPTSLLPSIVCFDLFSALSIG